MSSVESTASRQKWHPRHPPLPSPFPLIYSLFAFSRITLSFSPPFLFLAVYNSPLRDLFLPLVVVITIVVVRKINSRAQMNRIKTSFVVSRLSRFEMFLMFEGEESFFFSNLWTKTAKCTIDQVIDRYRHRKQWKRTRLKALIVRESFKIYLFIFLSELVLLSYKEFGKITFNIFEMISTPRCDKFQ